VLQNQHLSSIVLRSNNRKWITLNPYGIAFRMSVGGGQRIDEAPTAQVRERCLQCKTTGQSFNIATAIG